MATKPPVRTRGKSVETLDDDAVRFTFTLPPGEAKAVDDCAAAQRRRTGELVHRAELIRAALLHFVGLSDAEQGKVLGKVEKLKRGPKM